MTGELEAVGTAVEGAILGAVVEGAKNDSANFRKGRCLNCGAALAGAFCAACGQKAEVHRTLSAIWHDILHSVLHFDGKLWRTLPLLAFKPGELTRRYIHGERAKFVSPMALFLFSIFLMFAVFSFSGGAAFGDRGFDVRKEMAEQAVKLDEQIAQNEKLLASGSLPETAKPPILSRLQTLKAERNGIAFATTGKPIYDDAGAKTEVVNGIGLSAGKADTGWKWLDKTINTGGEKMVKNPGLAFYKLQSNGYKFAWLLVPLSLPFVWLATIGARGHRFYDHAVFTTYSIAFMCLLFLTVAILARIGVGEDITGLLFIIVPPLHIYKQLRHTYGFSRRGTLLRLSVMLLSIILIISLFSMILLLLGLLG